MPSRRPPHRTLEDVLHDAPLKPVRWLLLCWLLAAIHLSPWWRPSFDACSYLSIARSLAHTGSATDLGTPSSHFPVGYPLLIAPLFWLQDDPFLLLSLFNILAAGAAIAGVYSWARRLVPRAAVIVPFLLVVNVTFWEQVTHFQTEMVFLAVGVWAANLFSHALRTHGKARILSAIAACILIALCILVRTAGLAIALGCAVEAIVLARRGRIAWPRAAVLSSAMLLLGFGVAVASVWTSKQAQIAGGGFSYADQLPSADASLPAQILECVRLRISEVGRLLIPGMYKSYAPAYTWLNINIPFFLVASAFVVVGYVRLLRGRRSDPWLWCVPFYVGVYLIWPFDQGTRFLFPLLPILWLSFWPWIHRFKRHRLSLLFVLGVIHLIVLAAYAASDFKSTRVLQQKWPTIRAIADSIPAESRDKVAASRLDRSVEAMLAYTLDRRLTSTPPTARWLITPSNAPPVDGFTPVERFGEFELRTQTKP